MKNKGCYQKGHRPANPIRKGEHRGRSTEFKKGSTPKNKLSVGSKTIRIDKDGHKRRWIKVAEPNKWIEYAMYLKGLKKYNTTNMVTHHIDENTINDSVKNIALISRAEHINIHRPKLLKARRQNASSN